MPSLSESKLRLCGFATTVYFPTNSPIVKDEDQGQRHSHNYSIMFLFRAFVNCCAVASLIMVLLLTTATFLTAQTPTATLSGTITDQNGSVLPGVKISVINLAQGFQRETVADEQGSFVVPLLPPGKYTVKAEHTGFAPAEIREVILNVNDRARLDIQLQVGTIDQRVDVKAEVLMDESPHVGTLIDRQFLENLPNNGRSFQSIIGMVPGVVFTKAKTTEQGQFSVNGQRPNANYFIIDGVSANIGVNPNDTAGQATGGTLPGVSASGGTNNLVSIDALEEFKVLTSTFAPEFGRTPGAQVSIVTRGGSNEFHGTLFNYFRNDALDANDWFANSRGLHKPALRQNDFGGVVGGPLYLPRFGEGKKFYNGHNHTFFFFSYEGLRLRLPQTGLTTVPSLNARQIAPITMQPFLNAFPHPNGRDLTNNFSEFNSTLSDPSTLNATSIRLDQIFNEKVSLFVRYNDSPSETSQRGASGLSLNTLNRTQLHTRTLTAGSTLVVNALVNNDFRVNYSHNKATISFTIDPFGGAMVPDDALLFPNGASAENSLFDFNLNGTNTRLSRGRRELNVQRQFNVLDTLSVVTGSHQLKFGVDYRRLFPIFDFTHYSQQTAFAGVDGALTSKATFVLITAFDGPTYPVFKNLSLFGQDTWRVTRRLMLTYGLRWDVNPPPSDSTGAQPFVIAGLDNPTTITQAPPGTPLYKTIYDNFAPRFGFAYNLSDRKGAETILRGGVGIFYDIGSGPVAGAFGISYPFSRNKLAPGSLTPNGVPFPLNADAALPPAFNPNPPFGTIWGAVDPNFKLPYTWQWNFAVERSIGPSQTVSVSYVAAVGRRLLRQEVIQNPNPNFTTIFAARNSSTSDYHAMQLQFQRRLSRRIQALASYTWSHSIDNVSSDSTFEVSTFKLNPQQERGDSDFDVRHASNATVTYDLPSAYRHPVLNLLLRNFSVDTILVTRSATPVNIRTGANAAGGFSVSRPDLILGVPLYIDDANVGGGRRINRQAFSTPNGRQGTLGRNALRGFGMWQLDFAVHRQFSLGDKLKLQLRTEFFNIFNHPNFGDPGANSTTNALTNPQFGQSVNMLGRSLGSGGVNGGLNPLYQTGGPRSIQLALKLKF
ncbi:MAG TPA: carboxypeptidase regulatory-like domain-containing protein [Pyrinomonadaceae bacterium]